MRLLPIFRPVETGDLNDLVALETLCFEGDRLSRRSFRHWIRGQRGIFKVIELEGRIIGYGLIAVRRGSRIGRLYSLALHPERRGQGLARELIDRLEAAAAARGLQMMRLEVAKDNPGAIALYAKLGYRVFGEIPGYYENGDDAWRLEKRIAGEDLKSPPDASSGQALHTSQRP